MVKAGTYKEKNRLLLIGVVLFAIGAYWLSVSRTVELYMENNLLEAQLDSAQSAPVTISQLNNELKRYESSLSRFSVLEGNWEEHLLQQVGQICQVHQVTLIQMPIPIIEAQNGYEIQTRIVKLEGSFINLVQSLYEVENTVSIGRVSSVQFMLEENKKTRKTNLVSYIYMQHLEKGREYDE